MVYDLNLCMCVLYLIFYVLSILSIQVCTEPDVIIVFMHSLKWLLLHLRCLSSLRFDVESSHLLLHVNSIYAIVGEHAQQSPASMVLQTSTVLVWH